MPLNSTNACHAQPCEQAFKLLQTHSGGLSEAEAARRLEQYGANELPEAGRPTRIGVIIRQLNNPLTYILLIAAIVSFSLGERTDGLFICAVVVINVTIGAFQEWRAEASAASLKKTLRVFPTVIRSGVRRNIDLREIVPGDIVHLESGSVVPADMRLAATHDLKVDESLLTGESLPVDKSSEIVLPEDAPLGDQANMAHAGTMIVAGRGTGVVCATGARTELGVIAKLLGGRDMRPPLLIRMESFSNRIGVLIVAIAIALGAMQYFQGAALSDVFLLTVALAVSAIPEGLPVAITVALAIASSRMGRRNVIVRRLPAVEALGSCTIVATDKTGTLTANQLTAKRMVLATGEAFEIEGEGLELEGAPLPIGGGILDENSREAIRAIAAAGALTNEADINLIDGVVEARGDAVDIAFLVLANKLAVSLHSLRHSHASRGGLPYEPAQGFSSALHANADGCVVSVKGAPEAVLPMCATGDRAVIAKALHGLASNGFRVIAVAQGVADDGLGDLNKADLQNLRFLGFVGLIDPLRSEAPGAVAAARAAGLDIRMITGDHPETAMAIARQLDPAWPLGAVLTGADIAGRKAVNKATVYARVEPAQKTLIVRALQDEGHFVAVTGDGVNDAPALKAAHVGVAMGAGGTDVARAASDLIITDDNFASIVSGIEEGRASYDNIRKIVWLLISTAVTEVAIFALALLTGLPIPLTPVQILWLNLVCEGVQDMALAFEGKEPNIMQRRPRRPKEPIFNRQMIEQCLIVGGYFSIVAFSLFYWLYEQAGYDEAAARNLVLLAMVSFHHFHTMNCRSETRSFFSVPLNSNPFLIWSVLVAQTAHITAMHMPFFQNLLEVNTIRPFEWVAIIVLASTVLAVGETYKLLISRPRMRREMAEMKDDLEAWRHGNHVTMRGAG